MAKDLLKLKFAELHTPLFLNGKNHGLKLDKSRHSHQDIEMFYDREEKELLVTWNGQTAIVPSTNVGSMVQWEEPKKVEPKKPEFNTTQVLGSSAGAQVSTPMSHVHAGPGAGKTK